MTRKWVVTVTKQSRDQDLQFLTEHRQEIFKGRNYYLGILRGKVKVPYLSVEIDDALDESDLNVLSFGQFVAYKAQTLGLNIVELSQALQLTLDNMVKIYDDVLFPWDLTSELVKKISQTLNIPLTTFISVIRNQPLADEALKERLPQQTIAARTHHTLDPNTRKNELVEAQISIQRHREAQKRDSFVLTLVRND